MKPITYIPTLNLQNKIEKELFYIGLKKYFKSEVIDKLWILLEDINTNVLECSNEIKLIIDKDIEFPKIEEKEIWRHKCNDIIEYITWVYVSCESAILDGYILKDENDLGWL